MNFKNGKNVIGTAIFVIGVVSLIIGVIMVMQLDESQHAMLRFAGMLSGFGLTITVIGIIFTLREKFSSKEKLMKREIEQNDERNIRLLQAGYTAAAAASFVLMAVMSFVFCFRGYWFGTVMAAVCIYIQLLVFIIAYRVASKKM